MIPHLGTVYCVRRYYWGQTSSLVQALVGDAVMNKVPGSNAHSLHPQMNEAVRPQLQATCSVAGAGDSGQTRQIKTLPARS